MGALPSRAMQIEYSPPCRRASIARVMGGIRVTRLNPFLLLLTALSLAFAAPAQAQTKVKVGSVRSTVLGAILAAKERGYFKAANLDVDIELIDASASFIAPLSTNALNVVEGGMSAGLFNG